MTIAQKKPSLVQNNLLVSRLVSSNSDLLEIARPNLKLYNIAIPRLDELDGSNFRPRPDELDRLEISPKLLETILYNIVKTNI